MGAWGQGVWENDDAGDRLYDYEAAELDELKDMLREDIEALAGDLRAGRPPEDSFPLGRAALGAILWAAGSEDYSPYRDMAGEEETAEDGPDLVPNRSPEEIADLRGRIAEASLIRPARDLLAALVEAGDRPAESWGMSEELHEALRADAAAFGQAIGSLH